MSTAAGTGDSFDQLEAALAIGPDAALELLIGRFREGKEYARLFEALLMQRRREMGLPLFGGAELDGVNPEARRAYDEGVIAAAREVGGLFLAAGEIVRAWPYFRAIGETAPVAGAIASYQPADDADGVIEVALGERVHPTRGFELILEHHGLCRAISSFEHLPDAASRAHGLRLLARTLHAELFENLRRAIERHEGAPPDASTIPELIAGRDWLFGEYDYYVDTSHLVSVLRLAVESAEAEVIERALEMASYGQKLGAMFQYPGEPPLEDTFRDHAVLLEALLGRGVEAAVAHFRAKIERVDLEQTGSYPAQVLVRILLRLGRHSEAADVFDRYLSSVDANYLTCPDAFEICRLARDHERLKQLARARGDLLTYAAAALSPSTPGRANPPAGHASDL